MTVGNSFSISAGTFNHLTQEIQGQSKICARIHFFTQSTDQYNNYLKIQPSRQHPALRHGSSRCPWSLFPSHPRTHPLWVCEPQTEPFSPCSSVHQDTVWGIASDCPPVNTKTVDLLKEINTLIGPLINNKERLKINLIYYYIYIT